MDLNKCIQCMKGRQMNCAETVLYSLNETYGLGVTPAELHTMSGFGGGICGGMCGALCGSLAAMGKYHVYDNSHKTVGFIESCRELVELFGKELGATTCSALMKKYKTEKQGCAETVMLALKFFYKYREIESQERPQYVILGAVDKAIQHGIEIHKKNVLARVIILVACKKVSLEGSGCVDLEELRQNFGIDIRLGNEIIANDGDKDCFTVLDHSTGESYVQRYDRLEEVK